MVNLPFGSPSADTSIGIVFRTTACVLQSALVGRTAVHVLLSPPCVGRTTACLLQSELAGRTAAHVLLSSDLRRTLWISARMLSSEPQCENVLIFLFGESVHTTCDRFGCSCLSVSLSSLLDDAVFFCNDSSTILTSRKSEKEGV